MIENVNKSVLEYLRNRVVTYVTRPRTLVIVFGNEVSGPFHSIPLLRVWRCSVEDWKYEGRSFWQFDLAVGGAA